MARGTRGEGEDAASGCGRSRRADAPGFDAAPTRHGSRTSALGPRTPSSLRRLVMAALRVHCHHRPRPPARSYKTTAARVRHTRSRRTRRAPLPHATPGLYARLGPTQAKTWWLEIGPQHHRVLLSITEDFIWGERSTRPPRSRPPRSLYSPSRVSGGVPQLSDSVQRRLPCG